MTQEPPLCEDCQARLSELIDDWHRLVDVLRLDDYDRVHGMLLAVNDALRRCHDAEHDRPARSGG